MAEPKGPEGLEGQLVELKKWVAEQPNIPKDMDDKLLKRFLHSCYYNIEKTEKAVKVFTNMRLTVPELFADRDPVSPRVQKALKYTNLAILPVSGNRLLWVFQLNDPGLEKFDHCEFVRSIILGNDAWFLDNDNLHEADIILFDAKDLSWKIFMKINLSLQKKCVQYQEEAIPIRIKHIHMINTPTFIDKLFTLLKQFMTKEMSDLFHFHTPKSDTLFKYFSKDDLPKDFGGNLDSLEIHHQKVVNLLNKHSIVKIFEEVGHSEITSRSNSEQPDTRKYLRLAEDHNHNNTTHSRRSVVFLMGFIKERRTMESYFEIMQE